MRVPCRSGARQPQKRLTPAGESSLQPRKIRFWIVPVGLTLELRRVESYAGWVERGILFAAWDAERTHASIDGWHVMYFFGCTCSRASPVQDTRSVTGYLLVIYISLHQWISVIQRQ